MPSSASDTILRSVYFDWPAIPGYFGKPWFLPIVGAWYRYKDLVR